MKMSKLAVTIVASGAFFLLVGCGSSSGTSASNQNTSASNATTSTTSSSSSSSDTSSANTSVDTTAPTSDSAKTTYVDQLQPLLQQLVTLETDYDNERQQNVNGQLSNEQFLSDIEGWITQSNALSVKLTEVMASAPAGTEQMNQLITESGTDLSSFFVTFDAAVNSNDESKIATANQYLQKSNDELVQFASLWKQYTGQTGQ